MLRLLFLKFILITCTLTSYSQDSISEYFDYNWKECKKKDAFYFRVKKKQPNKTFLIKDYYISGELQMIGNYLDKNCLSKEGDFFYYYKSGQLEQKVSYSKNLLEGPLYGYHENGSISAEGEYKTGKKNGMFKYYYESGTVSWYEQFRMDSLVLRECWNEKGQEMDPDFPPNVDAFIAGGTRSLYFLVQENFSYPKEVLNKDVVIEVEVKFIVSKDGKISNIRVIGSKEDWIVKEMIRVFSLMPKWYPALNHMRPVESEVNVPLLLKHAAEK